MISSDDDAISVLNKWKSDSRLIAIVFDAAPGVAKGPVAPTRFFGFVKEVSTKQLTVTVGNETGVRMIIDIEQAVLGVGSYKDAPPEIQNLIAGNFASLVSIRLPTNSVFTLADIKQWSVGRPS